jgi:NADH-quinone oxidoreductase subunit M
MITTALLAFAVAALVLTIAPRAFAGRRAAELGAVASLVALVELARIPIGMPGRLWAEVDHPWIGALGARFHAGVDEISWPFALLTAALTLACCLWLWQQETSPALVALLMVIAGASLGVFVAQDLLLFFIFFEFALVPMWFVIARWGDAGTGSDQARRAAT